MEVVNCPGALKEALMRQQELAMATAQLSSDSFGGFNHGTRQSAVAGPMGFCKQANSSMPVGEHQMPFQELTDPEMWKPGLEGWSKDFITGSEFGTASAEPEIKKKRPGYAVALRHAMDEGTTTARKRVLDAASAWEDIYARPAGNNKARTLEQQLKPASLRARRARTRRRPCSITRQPAPTGKASPLRHALCLSGSAKTSWRRSTPTLGWLKRQTRPSCTS